MGEGGGTGVLLPTPAAALGSRKGLKRVLCSQQRHSQAPFPSTLMSAWCVGGETERIQGVCMGEGGSEEFLSVGDAGVPQLPQPLQHPVHTVLPQLPVVPRADADGAVFLLPAADHCRGTAWYGGGRGGKGRTGWVWGKKGWLRGRKGSSGGGTGRLAREMGWFGEQWVGLEENRMFWGEQPCMAPKHVGAAVCCAHPHPPAHTHTPSLCTPTPVQCTPTPVLRPCTLVWAHSDCESHAPMGTPSVLPHPPVSPPLCLHTHTFPCTPTAAPRCSFAALHARSRAAALRQRV